MSQLKMIAYLLLVGAIAYLVITATLFFIQRQLIFFPSSRITDTPDDYGMNYESVVIPLKNTDETIHGWWIPAQNAQAPVFLYLHGNGGNISYFLPWIKRFHSVGFSTFLFDYRGYGLSEGGFPSEQQVYEDAEIALNYLVNQRAIPLEQIYLFGHSLGSAVAIELATRKPKIAGLAVEGAFTSILDVAQYSGAYNWIPVNLLLTQRFNSLEKISQLDQPIFFVHGCEDRLIPAEMSQQLYDAARGRKELWLVEGANHENVPNIAGSEYEKRIWEFLVAD